MPVAAASPPAAALVSHGEAGEEVLRLRRDLEATEARARKAEFAASEAERKAQELIAVTKRAPEQPLVAPAPAPPRRRFPTLLNHPWN